MTEREAQLDKKLSEAFAGGGIRRRELRLTDEEAAWAAARYPVRVVPMGPGGDKHWYEIIFQGAEQ
ncbi:hypothetical protein [Intestinimonas timonensis]|uniref:hypothetical protein n=1 Tax=Intestinimonas timonensis TaxID=1689270 RepID=UPI0010310AE2|nr:hypothetical protein [Intestinimonas timonensis]